MEVIPTVGEEEEEGGVNQAPGLLPALQELACLVMITDEHHRSRFPRTGLPLDPVDAFAQRRQVVLVRPSSTSKAPSNIAWAMI